ncbi:MAG: HD domain-containing protein [Chitinophagales bacterium]
MKPSNPLKEVSKECLTTKYLQKVARFASKLLKTALPNSLVFHNHQHTWEVVHAAYEIGKNSGLEEDELEILMIAAWFHDIGHTIQYKGHEDASIKIATEYLEKIDYPAEKTRQVLECIEATRMPQNPTNLLQRVMCDADLYHFTLPNYTTKKELLRKEWELVFKKIYSDKAWNEMNLDFLKMHHYCSEYGEEVLSKRKDKNIDRCKEFLS